jgi:hypothetical protein
MDAHPRVDEHAICMRIQIKDAELAWMLIRAWTSMLSVCAYR